jgi:signal transduction histidine kinase/CheY-like chemotaxis protein
VQVAFAVACAVAFLVGIRRGLRPARSWVFFAVSIVSGGLSAALYGPANGVVVAAIAGWCDLASYGFGALGLFGLLRLYGGGDPDAWLDASVIGILTGMLLWEFVLRSPVRPVIAVDETASIVVAVVGTLIFTGLARFAVRPLIGRAPAILGAVLAGVLVIDIAFYLAAGTTLSRSVYDAMWLVGYAAWGAIALHPATIRATAARDRSPDPPEVQVRRSARGVVLQGLATAVGPALLWWHATSGARPATPVLLVGSVLLAGVVTARLARLVVRLARDVAERRTAEETLAALVEQSPVGIEIFNPDGTSRTANEAKRRIVAALAGCETAAPAQAAAAPAQAAESGAQARGTQARSGQARGDAWVAERGHADAIERAFSGEVVALEIQRVPGGPGGAGDLWLRQTYFPLRDAGQPGAVISITEDVSTIMRAQDERREVEERLRESAKLEALGVLAGGIAHDFNNLLVAILGHASLARARVPPDSEEAHDMAAVETAARRAADLAHQMLAYSGRGSFVIEPVRLDLLFREIADLVGRSIARNALVELEFTPELPQVLADATQLRQVLLNLIINASDALEGRPGVITLRTGVAHLAADDPDLVPGVPAEAGHYVALEIADTGCGMDRATMARIFDPFFTTKEAGRGLGLAATLGIVRGHGGALRVRSESGAGTRFEVLLRPLPAAPLLAVDPAVDLAVELAVELDSVEGVAVPDGSSAGRILIVDDEESVRRLASRVLVHAGYDVAEVGDGPEAIDSFKQAPQAWHGVLLDVTLPTLDGVTVLERLRAVRPDIRVVVSSGWAAEEVIARLGHQPGVSFLQKPYAAAALVAAFRPGPLDGPPAAVRLVEPDLVRIPGRQ